MLTVIIITIAIVAPVAAVRLATTRNRHEWLFWVATIVTTGSHVETWRLVNSSNLTSIIAAFGFFFAVYEVMAAPVLFVLVLENKRGKNNN